MDLLGWEIGETAHALRRAFDKRASALGVTRAQWRVLARLGRQPGLRQIELADLLDMEPITLCRILDRLADAGLVERLPDPDDRRAWRLELTVKAQPLLEQLRALADELSAQVFGGLGVERVEELRRGLAEIRDNLEAAEPRRKAVGS